MRPTKFDGQPIPRPAVYSPDRRLRYVLWRELRQDDLFATEKINPSTGKPPFVAFICMNPSTADESKDDPTMRRCIDFARRWGFDAFVMLNLFAWKATVPADMFRAAGYGQRGKKKYTEGENVVGPDNDDWLIRVTRDASFVVAAWGTGGSFMDRATQVRKLLSGQLHYLRKNADDSPEHPLYIPADTQPKLYDSKP